MKRNPTCHLFTSATAWCNVGMLLWLL